MKEIWDAIGNRITQLFKECWDDGTFSKIWKRATLVWIPKKKISLVPTLGKVLDKVINKRLQAHFEKEHMINNNQFAYRQNIGTIDALRVYKESIEENKRMKRHQLIVALDLSKYLTVLGALI